MKEGLMASKKSSSKTASSKKSSSKKSSSKKLMSLTAAANAGNVEAVALAVSMAATTASSKEAAILNCLIKCFMENGLPPVSPSALIDWSTIPNPVITSIGNCVRDCINGKGFQSPGWAPAFQSLKNQGMVS